MFCEGTYAESCPYAEFLHYVTPWYSARESVDLVAGRGFGFYACFLRDDTVASSKPTGLLAAEPRSRCGATA